MTAWLPLLAVDQRVIRIEAANRVGDPLKTIREVGAAAAPELHLLALLAGEDAEAVVLDFVQPAGTGGRAMRRAWARTGG